MYNIAICDDDIILCSEFEKIIDRYISEVPISFKTFYSGEALVQSLKMGEYFDLIFLDIELEKLNGVDVGRIIRDKLDNENLQIIYISAKSQYAMELFEIRPMNFLVKPISDEAIISCVEKSMKLSSINNTCFEVKRGTDITRVPYKDILYYESFNRKVVVHTLNDDYTMYGKLNDLEDLLPKHFLRIHQSYIINSEKVFRWKANEVILTNSTVLPISKKHHKTVIQFLLDE